MLQARMLLDLLKAPSLCMVCYGNVSSMRHIYGKSFDNTRQHIFLKTCLFVCLVLNDASTLDNQGHSGRLTVYIQTP